MSHLTNVEDLLEELGLFSLFTAELILLYMVKRKLLFLQTYLLSLLSEVSDLSLHIFGVSGGEKDVLNFMVELCNRL